ncbi:hypothetical protein FMEAI12_1950003 [Parafrankia sp. Ea1.12]|nr:hypothetical protein FMEAI12_1950003 [Parafrankia sp. Ea1.12]
MTSQIDTIGANRPTVARKNAPVDGRDARYPPSGTDPTGSAGSERREPPDPAAPPGSPRATNRPARPGISLTGVP